MFSDCAKQFKGASVRASSEETEKSFTEQLIEELKQREEEAAEAQQEADVKLLEAKKLASQYQKEADKCSSGMDTCEEAREKSADLLIVQKIDCFVGGKGTRTRMETWECQTTPESVMNMADGNIKQYNMLRSRNLVTNAISRSTLRNRGNERVPRQVTSVSICATTRLLVHS